MAFEGAIGFLSFFKLGGAETQLSQQLKSPWNGTTTLLNPLSIECLLLLKQINRSRETAPALLDRLHVNGANPCIDL